MKILVLNAGSSTYKSSLFDSNSLREDPLWEGNLDLDVSTVGKKCSDEAVEQLLKGIWEGPKRIINSPEEINCVCHRVVNGGARFSRPEWVTPEVKAAIRELIPLAPLHNPANLKGIEISQRLLPHAKQAVVFDTAFHRTIPESLKTYAIPVDWRQMGICRYGFHGISHEYCVYRARELLNTEIHSLKIVCCHLGNGSSLTAVQEGKSLDTTMGFTPLEGMIMGTRCGSIDPSIPLFLMREKGLAASEIDHQLNFQSGLKAICGTSDMRQVMASKKNGDPQPLLAFNMLVRSLCRNIGAMMGSLGGLDLLIFTGGIGENIPELRQEVCESLHAFGIHLDLIKNQEGALDSVISQADSTVRILLIHTREDLAIFRACRNLLS